MKGFHHLYAGILVLLVGFLLLWSHKIIAVILMAAGMLVMLDDIHQHIIQVFLEPEYRSPLHRLYGKYLWNIPAVKWLNRFVDRLLGA